MHRVRKPLWAVEKQIVFLSKSIVIVFLVGVLAAPQADAQTGISSLSAGYDNVTDSGGDYAANGAPGGNPTQYPEATSFNAAFNVGTSNNLVATGFTVSATSYTFRFLADKITINRVDNATVSGVREMVFYETESFSSPNINLKPAAVTTMQQALRNQTVNRGTDNVFQNQDNGDGNNNNIERVDFVFASGLSTPDVTKAGFLVLERNGNDLFKVAAIKTIDGSNNPTAFFPIVSVTATSTWGSSSFSIATTVMRADPADADMRPSTNVAAQTIKGIFFSLGVLGVANSETVYGYAIFPPDAGSDLVGLSDFPTTTTDAGGLDLIAGGAAYDADGGLLTLPVELTTFDVALDGRAALLTWQTASETNNAGFEIHSKSGEPDLEKGPWQVIDYVEGHGTTERTQSYAYRVDDLSPGRHVFRLKQIDYDGTFEVHPAVEVVVEMAERFVIEAAYPNPFNPQAQLRFAVRRRQHVDVALYDALGRRVRVLYDGVAAAGQMQTVQIDGAGLPSGLYLVRVVGEQFVKTQTVMLLK